MPCRNQLANEAKVEQLDFGRLISGIATLLAISRPDGGLEFQVR